MKKILILLIFAGTYLVFHGCSSAPENKSAETTQDNKDLLGADEKSAALDKMGIGKFTEVKLTHPLDPNMVKKGNGVYDLKCSACHRLTDEKLVGPGWKGVTDRRTPEWVMNFATNTEEMLNKDASAKAMMEVCMVRMPNQNLTDEDARSVYEYMRKNDGKN